VIVLDTNVVSEFSKEGPPHPSVVSWLDDQIPEDLVVTAVTVGELLSGLEAMPAGRRRDRVAARTERVIDELFDWRAIPFDIESARHIGVLRFRGRRNGRELTWQDAQIAAICHQYGAVLATRNVKDFAALGVDLVNPWHFTM